MDVNVGNIVVFELCRWRVFAAGGAGSTHDRAFGDLRRGGEASPVE